VHETYLAEIAPTQIMVNLCQWQDIEVEADEMWSFVGSKKIERCLWHAIDHTTGVVLAYVLSPHQDNAFLELKSLLEPFGITQFYTDA
jgi:insertion element IS1 protein InsB